MVSFKSRKIRAILPLPCVFGAAPEDLYYIYFLWVFFFNVLEISPSLSHYYSTMLNAVVVTVEKLNHEKRQMNFIFCLGQFVI